MCARLRKPPLLPAFFDPIHESQDHDSTAQDGHNDKGMGGFDHALLRRGEAYACLTTKIRSRGAKERASAILKLKTCTLQPIP